MNFPHPVCAFFLFILMDLVNSTTSQRQDYVFQSSSSQSSISAFLRILHVDENFAIIGERNAYYNVSLTDLSVHQKHPWQQSSAMVTNCKDYFYYEEGDCDAYVLAAVKRSSSSYWICASNARIAECRTHQLTTAQVNAFHSLQKWHVVNKTNSIPPLPLASPFQWNERITLVTKERALYVIGHFHQFHNKWCPMIYRDNIYDTNGGIVVGGLKSECDLKIFNLEFIRERATTFINTFESANHVYFTFSEPAMEVWSHNGKVVFSRIARVCKNDRGRGTNFGSEADQYFFSTLFKARILCGNEKLNNSHLSVYHEFKGHFPQYLHEIAAASSPHVSSVRGTDGQQVILAAFNSALGELSNHSAICAYRFSEIEELFNNHHVVVDVNVEACPGLYTANRPPARCYTDDEKITDKPAVTKYLLSEPIHPINSQTLYLSTTNYRITDMQIDWQVNGGNNQTYDVVFLSTDNGLILKLLYFAENNESPRYHVIQQLQVFQGDHIRDLRLMTDDNGDRYFLANTREKLKNVFVDVCEGFVTCNECRNEGRPYCSWTHSIESCGRFVTGNDKDLDKPCPDTSSGNSIQTLIITAAIVLVIGSLLIAAVMWRSRKHKSIMGSTVMHNLTTDDTHDPEKMAPPTSNFLNPPHTKTFNKLKVATRKPAKTAPSDTTSVAVNHFITGSVARRNSQTYSKKKVSGSSRGSNNALLTLNYVMPSPPECSALSVYKTVRYKKRKVSSDPWLQTLPEPSLTVTRSHSFH